MPAGRPTKYSLELSDEICAQLSDGVSLRTVCLADDMPSKTTVFNWLRTNKEFLDQYERAKAEAADSLADEILDIADHSTNDYMLKLAEGGDEEAADSIKLHTENIQRSRLRVDARKWIASKLKPKKYGEASQVTVSGDENNPLFPKVVSVNVVRPEKRVDPTDA